MTLAREYYMTALNYKSIFFSYYYKDFLFILRSDLIVTFSQLFFFCLKVFVSDHPRRGDTFNSRFIVPARVPKSFCGLVSPYSLSLCPWPDLPRYLPASCVIGAATLLYARRGSCSDKVRTI